MADDDKKVETSSEDKPEDKSPSPSEDQGGQDARGQAPLKDTSEKLGGKTTEDLVKMYGELERKLGEQSSSVAEAKKIKDNLNLVAQAIYADPELTQKVEANLQRLQRGETLSADDKKGDGGEKLSPTDIKVNEVRRAQENQSLNDFSRKFGLDNLKPEERGEQMKKIGAALVEMVDPEGRKSVSQVLSEVSLTSLPRMLENAYFLANRPDIIANNQNGTIPADSSIGRFSSSSSKSDPNDGLTESEKLIASKLGISEKDYQEGKKKPE